MSDSPVPPPVPSPDKAPDKTPAAVEPEKNPAAEGPEKNPAAEGAPAAEAAQPEAPAAGQTATPATGEAPRHKGNAVGVLMDVVLVLLLVAILGVGGYYVTTETAKYRIPSPMEQAMQKNEELTAKVLALKQDFTEAQKLLAVQKEYEAVAAQLQKTEATLSEQKSKYLGIIDEERQTAERIAFLQRKIKTTDASQRHMARSRLQKVKVGDVTRRNRSSQRVYQDATISYMGGEILLTSEAGEVAHIPVSELDIDSLPELVRYALGRYAIVDMDDFDDASDASAKPAKSGKKSSSKQGKKKRTDANYSTRGNGPVVDSKTDEAAGK